MTERPSSDEAFFPPLHRAGVARGFSAVLLALASGIGLPYALLYQSKPVLVIASSVWFASAVALGYLSVARGPGPAEI